MHVNPYLMFNGNCKEAFAFYERTFGAKIEAQFTFAETPAQEHVPAGFADKIMHVSLKLENTSLMGSDDPMGTYEPPKGISVALHIEDPAEAERVFNALSEGGTVTMPLEETFWAKRFGMCVDRFAIPWMIDCAKPMPQL